LAILIKNSAVRNRRMFAFILSNQGTSQVEIFQIQHSIGQPCEVWPEADALLTMADCLRA
jgi:hypothetical protein